MKKALILIISLAGLILWYQGTDKPQQMNDEIVHEEHDTPKDGRTGKSAPHDHSSAKKLLGKKKVLPKRKKLAAKAAGALQQQSGVSHQHEDGDWEPVEKSKTEFIPKSEAEKSLSVVAGLFSNNFSKPNAHKELLNFLNDQGLEPRVATDSNPDTGKMVMIRSERALTGTRYYHGQYFSNENDEMIMQHWSTEFKAGPETFKRTNDFILSNYNVTGKKTNLGGEHITYKLDNNYILWVKKMTLEDLKDDLYNAYEKADVGTVKFTIEKDIHGTD